MNTHVYITTDIYGKRKCKLFNLEDKNYTFRLRKHNWSFLLQAVAKDCLIFSATRNLSIVILLSFKKPMAQTITAYESKVSLENSQSSV